MARKAAGLTAQQVKARKAPGMVADGGGLYLQVSPGGAKSWVFRYQIAGKRRDMGLGSVDDVSLAEARDRARDARKQVKDSIDPIDEPARRRARPRGSTPPRR